MAFFPNITLSYEDHNFLHQTVTQLVSKAVAQKGGTRTDVLEVLLTSVAEAVVINWPDNDDEQDQTIARDFAEGIFDTIVHMRENGPDDPSRVGEA